jgi:hypothetical protein
MSLEDALKETIQALRDVEPPKQDVVIHEFPIVFSEEHDKFPVRVGNHHERHFFPRHWTGAEVEDWLWRKADREDKKVLRKDVEVKSREEYANGSEMIPCL